MLPTHAGTPIGYAGRLVVLTNHDVQLWEGRRQACGTRLPAGFSAVGLIRGRNGLLVSLTSADVSAVAVFTPAKCDLSVPLPASTVGPGYGGNDDVVLVRGTVYDFSGSGVGRSLTTIPSSATLLGQAHGQVLWLDREGQAWASQRSRTVKHIGSGLMLFGAVQRTVVGAADVGQAAGSMHLVTLSEGGFQGGVVLSRPGDFISPVDNASDDGSLYWWRTDHLVRWRKGQALLDVATPQGAHLPASVGKGGVAALASAGGLVVSEGAKTEEWPITSAVVGLAWLD